MTILENLQSRAASDDLRLDLLLVDDSRLQRRILETSLSSTGHRIRSAESAEDALEKCEERRPDIVISDWMMPGMTGLELCDALRQRFSDDYVYFIILTSKSEKDELAEALNHGADDFLAKPVSGDELAGRIAAGARLLRMSRELREKNRLISSTLRRMRAMNEELDRDLAEARKLQLSLAPDAPMRCDEWHMNFMLHPSGHIGGDLIGSFPIDDTRVGIYSLDVSGHGITSALITARLSSWLSGLTPDQNIALIEAADGVSMRPLDETCSLLNRRYLQDLDTSHYFTLVIGMLDMTAGRFVFAQAGHPHPMLQKADGRIELLGQGGPPIGLLADAEFETCEIQIERGDRILLYSDGVTECPGSDGSMLDESGLIEFLRTNRDRRGNDLLDDLWNMLTRMVGDDDVPDDVSGILIARDGDQDK